MVEKSRRPKKSRKPGKLTAIALLLLALTSPAVLSAQETRKLSLDEALQMATKQNGTLNISRLREQYYAALKRSAVDIPRTQLSAEWGNINSAAFDNRFTISQTLSLPSVYSRQRDLFSAEANSTRAGSVLQTAEIARLVKLAYLQLQVLREKQLLLEQMDSVYTRFSEMARLRFEKGESNLLEKTTLENQAQQMALQLRQTVVDRKNASIQLSLLLNSEELLDAGDRLALFHPGSLPDSGDLERHPLVRQARQQEAIAAATTRVLQSRLLPDISLGYTNQSIAGWQLAKDRSETWYGNANRFSTVQLGVSIPIFNRAQQARIKAARQQQAIAGAASDLAVKQLQAQLSQTLNAFDKYGEVVNYYRTSGLTQSNTLLQTGILSYKNGAIGYVEWGALAGNAIQIRLQYIEAISSLATQRIELDYLLTQ
jgi:cobalt-zinc-cadmium resistance protein CzcA